MPDRTAIGDEDLAVFGDYLCEQTGRCTCEALDTGAQVVHRDDCGYEPVYTVSNVTWALGVRRRPAQLSPERCTSCEHAWSFHQAEGCQFSVVTGRADKGVGCPCSVGFVPVPDDEVQGPVVRTADRPARIRSREEREKLKSSREETTDA